VQGADPVGGSIEDATRYFRGEVEKYGRVVKANNLYAD
jgi:hypothetical protein